MHISLFANTFLITKKNKKGKLYGKKKGDIFVQETKKKKVYGLPDKRSVAGKYKIRF